MKVLKNFELEKAKKEFMDMREGLYAILKLLLSEDLLSYNQSGNIFSFVLKDKIADSIIVGQGSSGIQLSFPTELSSIASCEYSELNIYYDCISFVCNSVHPYDKNVVKLSIPITYVLAQFLQSQKEIDIGSYVMSEDYSITYKSLQYLKPVKINYSLLGKEKKIPGDWLQQTLSGKCFASLADNSIDISDGDKVLNEKLKTVGFSNVYDVLLCGYK